MLQIWKQRQMLKTGMVVASYVLLLHSKKGLCNLGSKKYRQTGYVSFM